jgi:hypothetical protein
VTRGLVWLGVVVVAACAPPHRPPVSTQTTARRPVPDEALGITLRKPLNPAAFTRQRCVNGRAFAFIFGHYSVVSDDALFSVPHEHDDSAAVLAALDSFTVCIVETRELSALAFVTLDDSLVSHATIFWDEEDKAPKPAEVLALLTPRYGEPLKNAYRVQYWSADSIDLYINSQGLYNEATAVTLDDSRACRRFERLVHRGHPPPVYVKENGDPDPSSTYCWVQPQ